MQKKSVNLRYGDVSQQKNTGATYTPSNLANFVAQQILQSIQLPQVGKLQVLDPAVGDGELLLALLAQLPSDILDRTEVLGFDTDMQALANARQRLQSQFPQVKLTFFCRNFLDFALENQLTPQFDVVIANPPYVRTQILGGQQAQLLATTFGLTGRVDLYYPFLICIAKILREGGVAGVITSNRFMSTKSGQSVRQALLSSFQLLHVWDLGDTKLFDSAVLPAVLIAKANTNQPASMADIRCSSIYACVEDASTVLPSVLEILQQADNTIHALPNGKAFRVRHGRLENGGTPTGLWRVGTLASDDWLATVAAHTWANFSRIGKIRVGVKSTADKVFVRADWDTLPGGKPELLQPLITRHCGRRFRAQLPSKAQQRKHILYPHYATANGRAVVDLANYPKAAGYLQQHRAQLEGRQYLIDAGRNWYELWVPQDPQAWPLPKLVFLDIAEQPVFWIDLDGGIVNGECYWLRCDEGASPDLLWLALAVANSSFIEAFYDKRFNNKLYAGRRRFITQYVELFPLPDPSRSELLIQMAKDIHACTPSNKAKDLAAQLNSLVWRAFGLQPEPD